MSFRNRLYKYRWFIVIPLVGILLMRVVPKYLVMPDIIVASSVGDNRIVVHTGGGRILYSYELENTEEGEYKAVLFPSLSADGSQLLFVHLFGRYTHGYSFEATRHELCKVDLNTGAIQVLLSTGSEVPILSPIWYDNGNGIILLQKNELVALDSDGQKRWDFAVNDVAVRLCSVRARGGGGYIRLSDDEKTLYIYALQEPDYTRNDSNPSNTATMNMDTHKIEWSSMFGVAFTYGKTSPRKFSDISTNDEKIVTMLFGSVENPVLYPSVSADGNYYFYQTKREGFFTRYWIEGHSQQSKETFNVLTYRRMLYSK